MAFWIYNFGLAVPLTHQMIQSEQKIRALKKLSRTARIHDSEEAHSRLAEPKHLQTSSTKLSGDSTAYQTSKTEDRHQLFRADQIMSAPVTSLEKDMSIESARNRFVEKRFRHFPVINSSGDLIGIVSDRDLLKRHLLTEVQNISATTNGEKIVQIMQKEVLVASAETHIREICRVMFNHHIGAVPIVNDHGKPLGILTRSDILRAMIQHAPIELWS